MLKIGIINYINAYPLFAGLLKKIIPIDAEFVAGTPTELNLLLREKKLDIALISSTEYLKNQNDYCPIPCFGISAKEEVKSVLFYAKNSFTKLHTPKSQDSRSQVQKLGITKES